MEHDGYRFHPRQTEGIYNPARILHNLSHIQIAVTNGVLPSGKTLAELGQYLLSIIPSDPNTLPAQSTLNLISHSAGAMSVFNSLLAKDNASLHCPEGLTQRFRLAELEITSRTQPLLSFLYYSGAVSHSAPSDPPSTETYLSIPNTLARTEFLEEARKMLHLTQHDVGYLRNGIVDFVEKQDFSLFAAAMEAAMRGFTGRASIVAEDAFSSGIFVFEYTFIFIYTFIHTIYSHVYGYESGYSPWRQSGKRVQSRPTNSQGRRKWCCC